MVTRDIRAHQGESQQFLSAEEHPWHERPHYVSSHFFGPGVSLAPVGPETALLSAVLEDALVCFQNRFEIKGKSSERPAQQAEEWFLSDDSHWLFSFVSICTVLGLDPEVVRRRLKHWSESHLDTPPKKNPARRRNTLSVMTSGRRAL